MTIYKENIQEIVDNWNGYPLQDPCDHIDSQGKPIPGVKPAINAGSVQLKCFINNTCPFYESGYKEDNLVFNESTFIRITPWLPDDLRNALTVTLGTNGMHFSPRWVFRHNYIYHKVTTGTEEIDVSPIDGLFDNFDINYKEVNQFKNGSSSGVEGVDETRYKAEQSWVVMKSIFDPVCDDTGVEECDAQAEWRYRPQPVTDSDITDTDLAYDYNLQYYTDYVNSWDINQSPPAYIPKPLAKIDKSNVQMPVQDRVRDYRNRGVHWRLMKRTPLFKGEDFFIRFYRQETNSVSNPNDLGAVPFSDEFKDYWALDITRNDLIKLTTASSSDFIRRKRNLAISPPSKETEKPDTKSFDFHDQAYYIIELGVGSDTDRYCIIITERSNPIFVNFVPGSAGATTGSTAWLDSVSKKFGDPAEITGAQLMQSKWFDITVRNHLGSLVIYFHGPGIDAPPWIIKRLDWIPEIDPVTNEPYLQDKSRTLFVPRGRMCIMGGNLRSGFIFGPLQYQARHVSMIYPPREQMIEREDMDLAFTFGGPEEITARTMGGAFKSSPFFLPSQGAHDLLFSSTDIFLEELGKHAIPVGEAAVNQPLFTHDAQFYRNYYESNDITDTGDYREGGFFYDDTIRDFSDSVITASGPLTVPRSSNIIVKKYRYMDDPRTRQQAFDVLIGMMAGDHQFTNAYWNGGSPNKYASAQVGPLGPIDHTAVPDGVWLIQSCKTPIVSSLRLIAHESETTRWNDGTSVGTGANLAPFDTDDNPISGGSLTSNSPYFIDATDHVMSFSDSWSSSGFSEMEHTGSINFYLNRGMSVDRNVTDELVGLQNKTFYIEIWAGYTELNRGDCDFDSYSRQNGMFKLFTGLCHGGQISYEYSENIMSCKIEDYTAVLKGMRFFNSPWFDGVKDINCINEIMQMAGFRDVGKYDPGHLVKSLSNSVANNTSTVFYHHLDGRLFKMESYALPSGYKRLDQPAFKFNDGDPFMDAVSKIAKRAGKIFFFDQFGIAHYENFQDLLRANFLGGVPLIPLCSFTTNPEIYPGQLVFNKLERFYEVDGVYNHIKIMSNTPDFHLLIADDLNWSSMNNPESEGFIGYLKSQYSQETMFGSKAAVLNAMAIYSVGFRPKIKAKFSTYGVPLRANDIIQINGENTRVIKVTNTIDAEKNEWWMEVETEKYQIVNASTTVS